MAASVQSMLRPRPIHSGSLHSHENSIFGIYVGKKKKMMRNKGYDLAVSSFKEARTGMYVRNMRCSAARVIWSIVRAVAFSALTFRVNVEFRMNSSEKCKQGNTFFLE